MRYSEMIELCRRLREPLLLTPLPYYAPDRERTEHTAALVVRGPITRTVQVVRGKGGKLYLDIETCDMQAGVSYVINMGDRFNV